MLHLGDIVGEIATKRRGKFDNKSVNHDANGQETVNYWRVFFEDGKQPLLGIIKDEAELPMLCTLLTQRLPYFEVSGDSCPLWPRS
jgi:hypothetical protein